MAIEARHINNPFPSQITTATNRELLMNQKLGLGGSFFHSTQMGNILPLTTSNVLPETVFQPPLYQLAAACDLQLPGKASAKEADDSGLTCINNNVPVSSRKRSRDYYSMLNESSAVTYGCNNDGIVSQRPKLASLLEQEAAFQIQQQQREFDCLISQHTQRLRLELEQRAKQQSKVLVSAIQEAVSIKLKEKDEEIQKLGKLNWALQERIRALCMENQIWRGLAQSNEAAANSLRTNLEQVLAHASVEDRNPCGPAEAGNDNDDGDAESCCGSSDSGSADDAACDGPAGAAVGARSGRRGWCKVCGAKESSVLLLPCRHLCLCTACGSTRHTCPLCSTSITASVHVNLS